MQFCRIDLHDPPEISAMGIPRHGEARPVDDYVMPDHWCFHIYSYQAKLDLDGVSYHLRPGAASLIPPGTRMVYRYQGPSEHVYFHFKLPSAERGIKLPMVFDLGESYESMDRRAKAAVSRPTFDPAFAVAVLWSLLWEVVDNSSIDRQELKPSFHPLVTATMHHIEQRLGGRLTVAQLCSEVGVSNGYLSRLFKVWLGRSVQEHIRLRRADHAEHLLKSTNLPIKAIAATVGIPDLHQFNRLLHETKGAGPREIRKSQPLT
ncbi:MAG: AraC family transcriptional regulator [Armatimonadota bacterium]